MKFKLVEEFLFEDIETMMKYYPSISKSDFMRYIALDPTYKEGSNSAGKYAKWILNLVKTNKLTNIGHVKDLLSRFEANKNHLKNKDIMSYKSMADVEGALNSDDSYQDLSHRQEVRQRQNDRKNADLNKEATKVYEDKDWEVWVPHTYAASCKLGQETNWCTASTESDEYYNLYKKRYGGEYYININKHNRDDKYQFHFESEQFMDKDDEECFPDFFDDESTRGLQRFYAKKFDLNQYGVYLPEEKKDILKNGFIYDGTKTAPKYVTKVIISKEMMRIDLGAFEGCTNLTSVEIPNSVRKICARSFVDCENLSSIKIPNSVTEIGYAAFGYCTKLTSIKIPNSVTEIGREVFKGCDYKLLTIFCEEGSRADEYAKENNIKVKYI